MDMSELVRKIQANPYVLKTIPDQYKTYELYLAVVKKTGIALRFVPEHLRDYQMCLQAVLSNEWALEYVPKENNASYRRICLEAVQKTGYVLKLVPTEFRDKKMCMAAVTATGRALEYVPRGLRNRNPDLCEAAVMQDPEVYLMLGAYEQLEQYQTRQASLEKQKTIRDLNPYFYSKYSRENGFL